MHWAKMEGLRIALLLLHVTSCFGATCVMRCGQTYNADFSCQCNDQCTTFGDCCPDYSVFCRGETCQGRCGQLLDSQQPCQCNAHCVTYSDCCPDYQTLCTTGADGGGTGSVDPFSAVMQDIWAIDVNRLPSSSYSTSTIGSRYFSSVTTSSMGSTFQLFISLLDNYERTIGQTENQLAAEVAEEEAFLDAALQTEVMTIALTYLKAIGKVTSQTDFRATLRELWFNLYPRSRNGPIDSSGFEHVFVGERKGTSVSGFHSWVQFYLEEAAGNLQFSRLVSTAEPNMRALAFTWYGGTKSKGSFFVGTSPEFDMAVYTICALVHQNSQCDFTLYGKSVSIQTYDISHKTNDQIGSAYPVIKTNR